MDLDHREGSEQPTPQSEAERIGRSAAFRSLVGERSRFTWALTVVTLVIYFGFILMVAFGREFLARPIGGGATTIGIPVGIGVIVAGVVLTGIYVHRANGRFDEVTRRIREEAGL